MKYALSQDGQAALSEFAKGHVLFLGKKVVNVVAADAPQQGSALAQIRADVGRDAALCALIRLRKSA